MKGEPVVYKRAVSYLALAIAACLTYANANAGDTLGFYTGGSVGQSNVRASHLDFIGLYPPNPTPGTVSISKSTIGWKVFAGIRPISLLGAEIAYTDFGHPTASQGPPRGFGLAYQAALRARATTALGVLYAPVPVHFLDVYAKAGVARLETTADASGAFGCWAPLQCAAYPVTVRRDQTDARFAYGAGVQARLRGIGVRLEYERISAATGNPDLLSVGLTWNF
jgi:Outer membrane protein beta-barrel domain